MNNVSIPNPIPIPRLRMAGRSGMGRGRKETCWLQETAPRRQPRERYLQAKPDVGVHGIEGRSWRASSRSKSYCTSRCLSKIARLKNDRIFPEVADGLLPFSRRRLVHHPFHLCLLASWCLQGNRPRPSNKACPEDGRHHRSFGMLPFLANVEPRLYGA